MILEKLPFKFKLLLRNIMGWDVPNIKWTNILVDMHKSTQVYYLLLYLTWNHFEQLRSSSTLSITFSVQLFGGVSYMRSFHVTKFDLYTEQRQLPKRGSGSVYCTKSVQKPSNDFLEQGKQHWTILLCRVADFLTFDRCSDFVLLSNNQYGFVVDGLTWNKPRAHLH